MSSPMNIGEAAKAAGVSAKMIRHYESLGLLKPALRSDAGYRQYGEREVELLRFIRQARRLGFSMGQIADLLGLWSDSGRTSREVKALAERHAADLAERMREMAEMKDALDRLISACRGDDDPHCAILDELAEGAHGGHDAGDRTSGASASSRSKSGPSRAQGKASRKRASPAEEPAPSSAHLDLMAWTRRVRGSADG